MTSIEAFIDKVSSGARTRGCLTEVRRIPGREAQVAEFPDAVPEWLRRVLSDRGVSAPYNHQSAAWQHVYGGEDVVVVTPTASGKTLCYNVPVLTMLGDSADGCALYLYPTKALSQDQCAELNALLEGASLDERAYVYDGDTAADVRRRVRERARVVLSNPDMLHTSILPHHDKWRRLFGTLRTVIIDEMHTYRGVFGSHVANIVRRLLRICRHYGSSPQFVFTSATIANPLELAESLLGRRPSLVAESGAPSGEKVFALYNPPVVDVELQRRQSPTAAAHGLTSRLMRSGHHAIVFTRSRKEVEILTRRLKETFDRSGDRRLSERTSGYRGGYLPEERRAIERGLRQGSIQGVVSTNALELGIDIGSLDVCVIAGYPGTIASTWQQAGRAGRRQSTSLAILIAGDDPVDQYLVNNPSYFFEASPEHGRIDADNLRIVAEHMKCALFELPFGVDERFGTLSLEDTQDLLAWFAEEGRMVIGDGATWRWSSDAYPAGSVNIRDIYDENFVIVDTTHDDNPRILGEIDFEGAHKTIHLNAIYQHAARLFEVHRLDYAERKGYVRRVEPEYFTQAIDQSRVFVLDVFDGDDAGLPPGRSDTTVNRDGARPGWGEVRAVTRFTGYKKIRFKTFENIGYGEIALPDLEKHTTAYWATFGARLLSRTGLDATTLSGALSGVGRAMHTVAIVNLMCSAGDLHVTIGSRADDGDAAWPREPSSLESTGFASRHTPGAILPGVLVDDPTVYLYDHCPGGVGFSEKLFALHDVLLAGALGLIERCPCSSGCPSCVGPPDLVTDRGREGAIALLRAATSA